jgi:Na+/citrate or Na+/malate symporter
VSRKLLYAVGFALMLVLGFIVRPAEIAHVWEKLPIFEAAFGFFGCLLIIIVSKLIGYLFLQKKEGYYDD